ncbi:MAG: DUF1127 domain-containing protein [Acetobacteraceae bacterium]|nr:DUF1127 domain-containing protein [Pseudomonadota bacterium]
MFQTGAAVFGSTSQALRPRPWADFAAAVRLAIRTQVTRQQLPDLPDHILADIGVSRSAALAEAARQPWDLTPPRRR